RAPENAGCLLRPPTVARRAEDHTARADAVRVPAIQHPVVPARLDDLPGGLPEGGVTRLGQTRAQRAHRLRVGRDVMAEVTEPEVAGAERKGLETRGPAQLVSQAAGPERPDGVEDRIGAMALDQRGQVVVPERADEE